MFVFVFILNAVCGYGWPSSTLVKLCRVLTVWPVDVAWRWVGAQALRYSMFPMPKVSSARPARSPLTRDKLMLTLSCLQGPGAGAAAAAGSAGNPLGAARSNDDDLLKQDVKDVGRDVFDINGKVVNGSDGYDSVLEAVVSALLDADGALDEEDAQLMATQVGEARVCTLSYFPCGRYPSNVEWMAAATRV